MVSLIEGEGGVGWGLGAAGVVLWDGRLGGVEVEITFKKRGGGAVRFYFSSSGGLPHAAKAWRVLSK